MNEFSLTHEERTRLSTEVAYAKMFREPRNVNIRGIALAVNPRSRVTTLEQTWRYLLRQKVRRQIAAREEAL